MGLLVAAEQVLHAGTGGREPHPQRDRFGRHELDALQQGGVAVGELAGRDQRPGPGEEELDTRIGRRGIGQESQRVSKPGCGAGGRALCHGVAGLTQSRDGGRVPLPRRTLNMMRALYRGCTAGGERLGAPLVRAQSPAAGRRLVDRPPDERMPEAKAARHLGLPNEVELQQLVQGLERRRLGGRRGGGGQLGFERVAGYRCPLKHGPCAVREKRELLGQRGRNRGRHVEIPGRELGNACRALKSERSGELLEIERVAAALLVESGCGGAVDRFTEELPSLVARQSADFDAEQCPRAVRSLERARRRAPALDEVGRPARRAPPLPAAGAAARRAVPPIQRQPSGDRRARAPAARSPSVARAARAPRGDCGSARAGTLLSRAGSNRESAGRTSASSVRTSSSSASRRRGSSPATYSSSASTNTQKGKSRSSSDADP